MNRHKEAIFDRFLQLYGKGAVGGTAPGDSNISTAGAALNYGRGMDEASSGAAQGAATATEADSNGAGAVGGNGASGAVDGGGGGGPGGGRIGANFFRMFGSMATGGLVHDEVVSGLLDNAKKYKLTLTEAIYEEISWLDLPKLRSKDTPDSEKLKILRKATEAAIKETKDAVVKKELEQVIKDVDKSLAADAGTPQ